MDEGYYTCVVEDSDDVIIRQTVRVIVGGLYIHPLVIVCLYHI